MTILSFGKLEIPKVCAFSNEFPMEKLEIPMEKLESLSRNPFVFSLFMRMNMVEHVGSGIGRMHKLMVSAGLPKPEYETEGMFNIILRRKGEKSVKAEVPELSELEKQILRLMSASVKPTIEELCEKMNRKKSSVYNALKSLRNKGLIS